LIQKKKTGNPSNAVLGNRALNAHERKELKDIIYWEYYEDEVDNIDEIEKIRENVQKDKSGLNDAKRRVAGQQETIRKLKRVVNLKVNLKQVDTIQQRLYLKSCCAMRNSNTEKRERKIFYPKKGKSSISGKVRISPLR
jgi:hypothetical protein